MRRLFTFISACILGHQVQADPVSFSKDLAPILLTKCQSCHGPKKAKGKYRVDTFSRAMDKGATDQHGFTPRNLDESEVYYRLITDDKDERMPLDAEPLSGEQISLFKRWIEEGSTFEGDQDASLASIIPPPVHPESPEKYSSKIPIQALAYGTDGKELFAGGYHEITVWNPKDGKLLRRIGNIAERSYAIDVSPNGGLLAVAGGAPGLYGRFVFWIRPTANSSTCLRVLRTLPWIPVSHPMEPSWRRHRLMDGFACLNNANKNG